MVEEIKEKTEEEITEEFLKEFELLRKKYKRDFAPEFRITVQKINIPD